MCECAVLVRDGWAQAAVLVHGFCNCHVDVRRGTRQWVESPFVRRIFVYRISDVHLYSFPPSPSAPHPGITRLLLCLAVCFVLLLSLTIDVD